MFGKSWDILIVLCTNGKSKYVSKEKSIIFRGKKSHKNNLIGKAILSLKGLDKI